MNDLSTPAYPYPQARLRVVANYSATDGSRPESLEVECNDDRVDLAEFASATVAALAAVAQPRITYGLNPPVPALSELAAELAGTRVHGGGVR